MIGSGDNTVEGQNQLDSSGLVQKEEPGTSVDSEVSVQSNKPNEDRDSVNANESGSIGSNMATDSNESVASADSQVSPGSESSSVSASLGESEATFAPTTPVNTTTIPPSIRRKSFFHKIDYMFGTRSKWNRYFEKFRQFQIEWALEAFSTVERTIRRTRWSTSSEAPPGFPGK